MEKFLTSGKSNNLILTVFALSGYITVTVTILSYPDSDTNRQHAKTKQESVLPVLNDFFQVKAI